MRRSGLAGARWFFHNVAKLFEPLMAKNKLYSYEYLRNLFAMEQNPADATDAQLKNHDMIVVGDPDYVVNKLEQFQRAGVSQVIFFKQSGRIPHQMIMKSLRLDRQARATAFQSPSHDCQRANFAGRSRPLRQRLRRDRINSP